jgi:hypothetical protein
MPFSLCVITRGSHGLANGEIALVDSLIGAGNRFQDVGLNP